jgi:hypothetical protein
MATRRILEKLNITEISGVDRPCQEHARVTIMKRAPGDEDTSGVTARIAKLAARVDELSDDIEKYDENQARDEGGRWSKFGAAAGRTARAIGRAGLKTLNVAGHVVGTASAVAMAAGLGIGAYNVATSGNFSGDRGRRVREAAARGTMQRLQNSPEFASHREKEEARARSFVNSAEGKRIIAEFEAAGDTKESRAKVNAELKHAYHTYQRTNLKKALVRAGF